MENLLAQPDPIQEINRRIAKMEQQLIDLIVPIQNIAQCLRSSTDIQYLIEVLKRPILIDNGNLKHLLKGFESEMRAFEKNVEKMNCTMKEHALGEIKYIGNRLNEIEKLLKKVLEDQLKKEVQIQFSCDGYELVKKPLGYDRKDPIEDPIDDVKKLLDSLPQKRWAVSLVHRFGLMGEKPKTYEQIGNILKVSGERAREIVKKSLRLCRHPCRNHLAKKITHKELLLLQ